MGRVFSGRVILPQPSLEADVRRLAAERGLTFRKSRGGEGFRTGPARGHRFALLRPDGTLAAAGDRWALERWYEAFGGVVNVEEEIPGWPDDSSWPPTDPSGARAAVGDGGAREAVADRPASIGSSDDRDSGPGGRR